MLVGFNHIVLAILDNQAASIHGHSVKGIKRVVCSYENANKTPSWILTSKRQNALCCHQNQFCFVQIFHVVGCFQRLQADEIKSFEIIFAPERRLTADEQRQEDAENQWFTPDDAPVGYFDAISTDEDYNDDHHVPSVSIAELQDIASIRYPDINFSKDSIPTKVFELAIKAIRSNATTPEELLLGRFIRFKLKRLSTWNKWQTEERKQLDQFDRQCLYGAPFSKTPGAIVHPTSLAIFH